MQSPSSILSYPHSPLKQQNDDKSNNNTPTNNPNLQTSNSSVKNGFSFIYKLTEIAAYTSAAISETYNTLTAGGTIEPESSRKRSYNKVNLDDVYDNDEISDVEAGYNNETPKSIDRKNDIKWINDDEPPPPYDNSWAMPKTNSRAGENSSSSSTSSASSTPSSPKNTSFAAPNVKSKPTLTRGDSNSASTSQTILRRRQIRVRRPRRLLRRKSASTEVSTPRGEGKYDDPDELLLKVSDKLSDMIAQGRAALTSTVDITEVDMLLAEERERDERIMKELGLQTPVGRKGKKNTADYDYFTSISDGNCSSPESFYEYGYGGHESGFESPSGYETPNMYTSHGHYNTPVQFGTPGIFHQTQSGFNNHSNLGFSMNMNNINKFAETSFNPIPNRYNNLLSSGFGDHGIPRFGAGPISGGFGGSTRIGRYAPNNNGFGTNSGAGRFGSNGGYGTGRMYNNREFTY